MVEADSSSTAGDGDLDRSALEHLRRLGGNRLLGEMIDLFLTHAEPRVAAAREGLRAGDLAAVERAGHSLKSTAANLGAMMLSGLAAEVEQAAAAGDAASLEALLPRLDASCRSALDRLRVEREGC